MSEVLAHLKESLKIISEKLKGIDWALIGSANMLVQGMDVEPNDIDILVKLEDLSIAQKQFPDARPVSEMKPGVFEFTVFVEGFEVQILGEEASAAYRSLPSGDSILEIQIDDFSVPCFPLRKESQVYRARGRTDKADMIEDFINQ